jgi:hypothetical protein
VLWSGCRVEFLYCGSILPSPSLVRATRAVRWALVSRLRLSDLHCCPHKVTSYIYMGRSRML